MQHYYPSNNMISPSEYTSFLHTFEQEPYSGEGEGLSYSFYQSGSTSNSMESNVGRPGDSSSFPVASAATNEPRARGKEAHRRRRATDKERIDNARRMREKRLLINDEKEKIKSLLASRQDHALPSGELQLWRAVAEYIERLQATNASLKRLAGIQWDSTSSLTGPTGMPYLPLEEPSSSYREPYSVNLAAPSTSTAMNNDISGAGAATTTPALDWSSFLASYSPGIVLD